MLKRLMALLAVVVGLSVSTGADAQVVLTFAAKRAEGTLGIPHSYVRISGTTESGEAIQRTFGYMPVEQSAFLALGDRVRGAVLDEPEAGIEWDRVTPFLSIQVPDTTLGAVILRFRYWNENRNGGYDAWVQNCIAFLADIAGTIGLKVPPGSHLSPSGFLDTLADMNPPGSVPGLLASPVPNPTPADLAPQDLAPTPETPPETLVPPAEPATAPT